MSELNLENDVQNNPAREQNQDQQQGNSRPFEANKEESGDTNPEVVEKGFTSRPDEDTSKATSWRSDDDDFSTEQKTFTGEASDLEDKAAGGF